MYFGSRVYAFVCFLPKEDEVEKDKHFAYAYSIHVLNLVHSLAFVILAAYLLRMAKNTYLVFKKEHYGCILKSIFGTALLYLLPLIGIIALSYVKGESDTDDGDAEDSEI